MPIRPACGWPDVLSYVRAERPAAVILDVEPLLAYWDTGTAELDHGVNDALAELRGAAGLRAIVFATNSRRRPSMVPTAQGLSVDYLAAAGKPLSVRTYRALPRPGVVIGDQVATDGVLAWRLGFALLRVHLAGATMPAGPRLMRCIGRPLEPLLFHR